MPSYLKVVITWLSVLAALRTQAQTDYYKRLKTLDLSKLWRNDSLLVIDMEYNEQKKAQEWNRSMIVFPEPLGFIDTNYQRFYIHYLSVVKNKANPYQYDVTGKTRVKNNICSFKGTINITKAEIENAIGDKDYPQYNRGAVWGTYKFYEDSTQPSSGCLSGEFATGWYLDRKKHIRYDNLDFISDGYDNNQFKGIWKSYKTKVIKKCNWGDYRIPESRALDIGAGEFSVNERYVKNGWQNYVDALNQGDNPEQHEKAVKEESKQWWKK